MFNNYGNISDNSVALEVIPYKKTIALTCIRKTKHIWSSVVQH